VGGASISIVFGQHSDQEALRKWAGADWRKALIPDEARHLIETMSLEHFENFSPFPARSVT
jgi:hypothetical protein